MMVKQLASIEILAEHYHNFTYVHVTVASPNDDVPFKASVYNETVRIHRPVPTFLGNIVEELAPTRMSTTVFHKFTAKSSAIGLSHLLSEILQRISIYNLFVTVDSSTYIDSKSCSLPLLQLIYATLKLHYSFGTKAALVQFCLQDCPPLITEIADCLGADSCEIILNGCDAAFTELNTDLIDVRVFDAFWNVKQLLSLIQAWKNNVRSIKRLAMRFSSNEGVMNEWDALCDELGVQNNFEDYSFQIVNEMENCVLDVQYDVERYCLTIEESIEEME